MFSDLRQTDRQVKSLNGQRGMGQRPVAKEKAIAMLDGLHDALRRARGDAMMGLPRPADPLFGFLEVAFLRSCWEWCGRSCCIECLKLCSCTPWFPKI